MTQAKVRHVIIAISCFWLSIQFGYTQPKSELEYLDRGDRMEGVNDTTRVGGAYIDLLGAYIDWADYPPIDSIKTVQLKFYLPDGAPAVIIVRDLKNKNYCMIPKQTQWSRGWNVFTWPTDEVLRKIPIQIQELMPIVITGSTTKVPVPALLACDGARPQRQNYAYVFSASGRANIIVTWLKKMEKNFVELESYTLNEPSDRPFVVDREFGRGVYADAEGEFRLQLRGKVIKPTRIEPVNEEYDFHYENIFEKK